MQDLIGDALRWLQEKREEYVSVEVVYRRGSQTTTVPATIGRSEFDSQDANGNLLRIETRDYLIPVDDLTLDDIPVIPIRGDVIVENDRDNEVVPPAPNVPEWSWTNPYRTGYRIHTRPVTTPNNY